MRIPSRLLVLTLPVVLFACAKGRQPETTTEVAPVSKAESQAIVARIQSGRGIAPGEVVPPAAGCGDFVGGLQDFVPGTLEVPEDWDHPETSPKIQVFYYYRKAFGEAEKRPPVVFFNGGPASDSHGSAELLAPLPFTAEQAFVFLDQRGTGCSSPFPDSLDEATAERLTRWGSRGIVGDAEAVRHHLFGDRKWRAYGQSYGGFIVHRYLEIAPEGLDRGIAHGASVMRDPISWMTVGVRSQQRVAANFFARYPGDRARLAAARKAIPETECWKNKNDKVCGPVVLDSLTILLGFQSSWPSLHQWIQALASPGGGVNAGVLGQVVRELVFGVYGEGGLAGNVISKMEIAPGYDDQAGCGETAKRLRDAGENPDAFDINECRLLSAYQSPFGALMRNVPARPISLDAIARNVAKGPSFFLFSGQQDVFVPYATFGEEVEHLGKAVHYETFPNSGHEGFYTEAHVTAAVTGTAKP
jgi:pimeloyl-ACP methyl ester carboxylesterase